MVIVRPKDNILYSKVIMMKTKIADKAFKEVKCPQLY